MSVELEPLAFIARLAALVPPPKRHLTRYFGLLSSHAASRSAVVPAPAAPAPAEQDKPACKSTYIPWAELLRKTFGFEIVCEKCHSQLRLIALIKTEAVAKKILKAMRIASLRLLLSGTRCLILSATRGGNMSSISKKASHELLVAGSDRYRMAEKRDKSRILSEFVALTGYHPKHTLSTRFGSSIARPPQRESVVRGSPASTTKGSSRRWSSFGRHRIGCAESGSKRFFLCWWIPSNATVTFVLTRRDHLTAVSEGCFLYCRDRRCDRYWACDGSTTRPWNRIAPVGLWRMKNRNGTSTTNGEEV
jgi:hypothetical protein